jgi:NAD(P)-dependent dehydrogenase (short-subunit alcohol dehydrogenase family)
LISSKPFLASGRHLSGNPTNQACAYGYPDRRCNRGSRGIGAETAFALASRGAFVLAHYNTSHAAGAKLFDRIRAFGGQGELVQADLSQSEGIKHFVSMIEERNRPLDILINMATHLS